VIVAPGKEASIPLQGAATFEVTGGGGSATIGARSHELGTGSTFAVPEGEPLKIAAKGDAPMTLRAYVVRVP
jgi:mannose-6-phosphate isomerase-like protein (cupin superfamily)